MTENQTITPEIQAAINSLYQQGFEAGRRKGYEEGINAARAHLLKLPLTPINMSDPNAQEQNASMSLSTMVEELDFTVSTYNTLKREGLHTIGDILALSDAQLLEFRNFGLNRLGEVKEKLTAIGYTLREHPNYRQ